MNSFIVRNIMMFVVLPLFWGSTFLGTKICLDDLTPLWMGTFRYALSTSIFLAFVFGKTRGNLRNIRNEITGEWKLYMGAGVAGLFLATFFQNIGLLYTTATVSSLISALEPVMVVVLAVIILKERLRPMSALGALIAFVGALIVISGGDLGELLSLRDGVKGNLMLLISMVSYGFYTIFSKSLVKKTSSLNATAFSGLYAVVFLFFSALFMEGVPSPRAISLNTWMAVIYMAVFPTCVSLFLYNRLLERVEASRMSVILFLMPIYGLLLGALILKDPLTPASVIGSVFTLFGVFLIEYNPLRFLVKEKS